MQRHLLFLTFLLTTLLARADGGESILPPFERTTTADGLHENNVRHILQLEDGRMVVTTWECINIIATDGTIQQFPLSDSPSLPLSNYHGGYHVYADDSDRLWLKDNGRAWCLNLRTGLTEVKSEEVKVKMDDIFIDSRHRIWTVSDTTINDSFCFSREWGELQDMDADSLRLYLFFASSTVACYDLQSHALEYTTQPFDTAEAKFYDRTSLVVRSQDGRFYQLRCGEHRNIFFRFDPTTQEWSTVFETTKGSFHTLCIPTPELALMACPEGLWEINLDTGEMQLHSSFVTTDGDTLRTGLNTVFVDRDGGLWLGSYEHGLLHAPTIHASRAYLIYYIAIGLAAVLLLLGILFYAYATRQRRRESKLMQRLREQAPLYLPPTGGEFPTDRLDSEPSPYRGAVAESEQLATEGRMGLEGGQEELVSPFLQRAIALVEQNLDTPGYNVEQLAADLCMERTGLYKKLTALLDQTPTLFMRRIRMERAARLLREGRLSIAEIAEQTGFSSASYFSRTFQETYGQKPSDYAKQKP